MPVVGSSPMHPLQGCGSRSTSVRGTDLHLSRRRPGRARRPPGRLDRSQSRRDLNVCVVDGGERGQHRPRPHVARTGRPRQARRAWRHPTSGRAVRILDRPRTVVVGRLRSAVTTGPAPVRSKARPCSDGCPDPRATVRSQGAAPGRARSGNRRWSRAGGGDGEAGHRRGGAPQRPLMPDAGCYDTVSSSIADEIVSARPNC